MNPKTLALIALVLIAVVSRADTYAIRRGDEANQVVFRSQAPLESFEGKTREVWGIVTADLADLRAGLTVHVEVDLASLDTGIAVRNRHMRENHLETAEYPLAVFHGTEAIDPPAGGVAPGQSITFRLKGALTLHGVTLPVVLPVSVERKVGKDGERLIVKSQFEVKLSDFAIPRPKFLVMKLNEVQAVSVVLAALPGGKP